MLPDADTNEDQAINLVTENISHFLLCCLERFFRRHQAINGCIDIFTNRLSQGRPFRHQGSVMSNCQIKRFYSSLQKVGMYFRVLFYNGRIISNRTCREIREWIVQSDFCNRLFTNGPLNKLGRKLWIWCTRRNSEPVNT